MVTPAMIGVTGLTFYALTLFAPFFAPIAASLGTTPLMLAAAAGKPAAVTALLDHGADVNAKEAVKGETALTFAAAFGRADVIRVLLRIRLRRSRWWRRSKGRRGASRVIFKTAAPAK